jgi:glycosyltransferase involved in cell wall biosynthesis
VPVIASQRGGLPEIIKEGVNGLLCDPDDPASLGRAMTRMHVENGLRERLAAQTRVSVEPLLDQNRMLDSYQQLFHQVLAQKNPHKGSNYSLQHP